MSGISENSAADAYEYADTKKKNTALRKILYGAGIAAIFCSFIALSFVLLKISGPKNVPDEINNAAAGSEMITGIETEKKTETEAEAVPATETEAEAVPATETKKSESLDFVENPVVWCSSESFYKTEPYKYFMPEKIPENFVDYASCRWVAGEYLCRDGEYHTVKEKGFITLRNNTADNGDGYIDLNIIIIQLESDEIKAAEDYFDPAKLSVDNVEVGRFGEVYDHGVELSGMNYSLAYSAGGCLITYHYKVFSASTVTVDDNIRQYLFDIVTSSQYFKDHPLSAD